MFYKKYFEGTVEAGAGTTINYALRNKAGKGTGSVGTANPKRNKVIGDAIVSTLRDCGLNAYYDETCSYVYLDYNNSDEGFYVMCTSSSVVQVLMGYYPSTATNEMIMCTSMTGMYAQMPSGYTPFETASYTAASNYKFYVTIKGDTAGSFVMYVGQYTNPSNTGLGITIHRATDKRYGKGVWGFYFSSPFSTSIFWEYEESLIGVIETSSRPNSMTVPSRLTMLDQWVSLIEDYAMYGFIVFNNTYIDPGFATTDKYYEIDGDVYYCYTPYLVKCVTEI